MKQEKIGKFISQLRKERNISQKELAEKLYISRQAISKWESGKALPDCYNLQKLAEIFDISLNELLIGEYIIDENGENIINFQINIYDEIVLMRKTILVLIIIIFCFIVYCFIVTYNFKKSFTNGYNDSIKTDNDFFIDIKEKRMLQLGNNEEDNIKTFKLIYLGEKDISYTVYYCKETSDIALLNTHRKNLYFNYNDK